PRVGAPCAVLELGRDRLAPERKVAREIARERLFRAVQGGEVAAEHVGIGALVHPPERVDLAVENLAQAQFLRHEDLRIEKAGGLDLALQERIQSTTEA